MDPDTILEQILDLVAKIQAGIYTSRERGDFADDLAEAVNNLDSWLRKGGALPKEWKNEHRDDPRRNDRAHPAAEGQARPFRVRRG